MDAGLSHILIVEDEDLIRIPLKEYLTRTGFTVLVASDGVGAIKQLLDFPVSYIITDYRMENLGGDYWMRFLQRYCGDMKVLVTSGFLKGDLPIPYQFLAKPYSFKELEERLRAL